MVIETNKSGIDETFNLRNYARIGKDKKNHHRKQILGASGLGKENATSDNGSHFLFETLLILWKI
ncbi:MAG: hypothetical protein KIG65_02375 [Eubacteriales bacterium]|nr:hypothetical protein [Eubacteriales bacterium]